LGGAEKLAAVKDAMHKTEISFEPAAGGFKMKQTNLFVAPDHIRYEQEYPSEQAIFYSDGKSGWMSTAEACNLCPLLFCTRQRGLSFARPPLCCFLIVTLLAW
jgi:hypothetical protein